VAFSAARLAYRGMEVERPGESYFDFFCFLAARFSLRFFLGCFFSDFPPLSLLATITLLGRVFHNHGQSRPTGQELPSFYFRKRSKPSHGGALRGAR
jgi:hypothetical protein